MSNNRTLQAMIDGMANGEAFVSTVYDEREDTFLEIDEYVDYDQLFNMGETWEIYLDEWFVDNQELIEEALQDYDSAYGDPAWSFGVDVAFTVLRSGAGFNDREFLDAELVERLEDSLDEYMTDDGVHEFWLDEDGELVVARQFHIEAMRINRAKTRA